jgi:hypothetical protein
MSAEREQVPDEDVDDGDHHEGPEPVPAPGGRQPMTRWRARVPYELDHPPHGTDRDQCGDHEQERVRHPRSGHISAKQGLSHMGATTEGTEPPSQGSERARKSEPRHEMYGPQAEADRAHRADPKECFSGRNCLVDSPVSCHSDALQ